MKDSTKKIIIIIGVIAIILLLLRGCIKKDGTEPANLPEGDWGATPVFADKEGKIVEGTGPATTYSTVVLPEGYPICAAPTGCSNVFLMRFTLSATHVGVKDTTVRVTSFNAYDGNNAEVPTAIKQSMDNWNCILNNPFTLTSSSPSHQWDPYDCAGDGSWADTVQFESLTQPIKFQFNFEGEYTDTFGILHSAIVTKEVLIYFGEGMFEQGGFTASVGFGEDDFIDECSAGQTLPCDGSDKIGSACEGLNQVCSAGLWPGCSYTLYQTWGINNFNPDRIYTGTNEFTGATNWKTICTDLVDNDCDGFTDKPLVDGSCPSGICDFDCPECLIKFRTNAAFSVVEDDTIDPSKGTYDGKWIIVDRDGDGILESYGNTGTIALSTSACSSAPQCIGSNLLTHTTLRNLPVGKYSTSEVVLCEDYNLDGKCEMLRFNPGDADRCKVGDADYPACLKVRPTPPWNDNQEVCENY